MACYRGIVPYFKQPGLSNTTIINWLQRAVNYDKRFSQLKGLPIIIKSFGKLDTFVSGVIVLAIGKSCSYLPYLRFCLVNYEVDGILGISTVTNYLDGSDQMKKSFEHVTKFKLEEACNSFIGSSYQNIPISLPDLDLYDLKTSQTKGEKSHLMNSKRNDQIKIHIDSVTIRHFNPPHFSLTISSFGTIYLRNMFEKLGAKLNTYCAITSSIQTRVGPFTKAHCFDKADLYWEYLSYSKEYETILINHIKPHLNKLPKKHSKYMRW